MIAASTGIVNYDGTQAFAKAAINYKADGRSRFSVCQFVRHRT